MVQFNKSPSGNTSTAVSIFSRVGSITYRIVFWADKTGFDPFTNQPFLMIKYHHGFNNSLIIARTTQSIAQFKSQ